MNDDDIKGFVAAIGRTILLGDWKPDYIVGINRGGLLPATLLSHYLNVPMHTLDVALRNGGEPESNCWMAEDAFGYIDREVRENIEIASHPDKRKNILIIDDINDTGATLAWIQHDWGQGCLPDNNAWDEIWNGGNVRTAVIVNNEASDYKHIDYSAFDFNKNNDDLWVVFPWEEWWAPKPE